MSLLVKPFDLFLETSQVLVAANGVLLESAIMLHLMLLESDHVIFEEEAVRAPSETFLEEYHCMANACF